MEVPEDCSIVPRPGTCVCPPGAFSGLAQGRKVFHCSSVCESAEKQHSLPSETQGNDCPSHTGLSQAHQHLSTLTARKRGCVKLLRDVAQVQDDQRESRCMGLCMRVLFCAGSFLDTWLKIWLWHLWKATGRH